MLEEAAARPFSGGLDDRSGGRETVRACRVPAAEIERTILTFRGTAHILDLDSDEISPARVERFDAWVNSGAIEHVRSQLLRHLGTHGHGTFFTR